MLTREEAVKHAPEWAAGMAIDVDGVWYWFEKVPYAMDATWAHGHNSRRKIAFGHGLIDWDECWRDSWTPVHEKQKRVRPMTMDDIPHNISWIRQKIGEDGKHILIHVGIYSVVTGSGIEYYYKELSEVWEYQTTDDPTWRPFTVEEE